MSDFDYLQLEDLIHSRVRLSIMTALITSIEVDFSFLKEKLHLSDGNLSVNMRKLEEAGYVNITKQFIKRKPRTTYRITEKGREAFEKYIGNLKKIIEATEN